MKMYQPSWFFRNAHINTCYPTFFRKIAVNYIRERLFCEDGDFLDFDWIQNGNKKLLLLCHGLEGSSQSHYIKAFAKYFSKRAWDILALNYRSCSGEVNPSPKFYVGGHGDEISLAWKLQAMQNYEEVYLVGFSLGANKTLHYLGSETQLPKQIKGAVTVSPPCDLKESSLSFARGWNRIYDKHFVKTLIQKIKEKAKKYPDIFRGTGASLEDIYEVHTLFDFDQKFTSKLAGYQDAFEYYEKNSSLSVLKNIQCPTLILTALDDPMMSPRCYPYEEVKKNPYLKLLTPQYGGHISYASFSEIYWLEQFVYEYLRKKDF